jgi:hypothetical protein
MELLQLQNEVALADWNGEEPGSRTRPMTREAEHVMWAEARARHHGAGQAGTVRKESTQTAPAISPHKSKKQRKMNAYAYACAGVQQLCTALHVLFVLLVQPNQQSSSSVFLSQ